MGKTKKPLTKEENLKYWKTRISQHMKMCSQAMGQALPDLVSECQHIGISSAVIEKFEARLNEAFEDLGQAVADKEAMPEK